MTKKNKQEIKKLSDSEKQASLNGQILISRPLVAKDVLDALKYLRAKCINNGHLSEFSPQETEILDFISTWMDPTTLSAAFIYREA